MTRRIWPACVLFAALAGCQESDPSKINNNLPSDSGTKNSASTSPRSEAEAAKAAQGKTGGAFTSNPKGVNPDNLPAGYPRPDRPGGTEAKPADTTPPADAPKVDDAKPADEPKTAELTADELETIKKLPEADQAIAIKQVVCLISGEHLGGAMGVPVKVEYDGKVGFLCCKGCKPDFDKDPAAAFAKLAAK
jgi:hypothetical protein